MQHINFYCDTAFKALGLTSIACAVVRNIDNTCQLPDRYQQIIADLTTNYLDLADDAAANNLIFSGYAELINQINRSSKKFPPSAKVLIDIIKRRGTFPRINTLVDIYNLAAIKSHLSIGVHDLAKMSNNIYFRVSLGEELFYPLGGGKKNTTRGDYLYADDKTILAWLGARDSELVKISPTTTDAIILIQGNKNTSLATRLALLSNLTSEINTVCGGTSSVGYLDVATGQSHLVKA